MLKKAKIRLLTRAAQNEDSLFAGAYRAATVRESVPQRLFQQPARKRRRKHPAGLGECQTGARRQKQHEIES